MRQLSSAGSPIIPLRTPPMPQELAEGSRLLLPLGGARSQRRSGGIRSRSLAAGGCAAAAGWAGGVLGWRLPRTSDSAAAAVVGTITPAACGAASAPCGVACPPRISTALSPTGMALPSVAAECAAPIRLCCRTSRAVPHAQRRSQGAAGAAPLGCLLPRLRGRWLVGRPAGARGAGAPGQERGAATPAAAGPGSGTASGRRCGKPQHAGAAWGVGWEGNRSSPARPPPSQLCSRDCKRGGSRHSSRGSSSRAPIPLQA